MFGRAGERERLDGLVREVSGGRGRAVVFRGEPGIGKTTLLDLAETLCREAGMTVLRGSANEIEQRLPFAAVVDCLGAAERPEVVRIRVLLRGDAPSGAFPGAAGQEPLVAEALQALFDAWCSTGPVALLLDDLHWADQPSLAVVHRLTRSLDQLPLLVVLTSRSCGEDSGFGRLLAALADRGVPVVDLGPLAEPDVARLVAAQSGGRPDGRLLKHVAGAAGNPLYVRELVSGLLDTGQIRVCGPVAELVCDRLAVPASLSAAILRRIGSLRGPTRELVGVLALLGKGFTAEEMTVAAQRSVFELVEPVAEALMAGVLEERGTGLAFRHDLVRRAVEESHPPALRAALHQRIGRSLAGANAPAERVAEHLVMAPRLGGQDVSWLRSELDRLLARAPGLAIDLLRRGMGESAERDLEVDLVRALLWAGRFAEAEEEARSLLTGAVLPSRWRGTVRWWLAQAYFRQGRLTECEETVRTAERADVLTPGQSARFHGLAAQCSYLRAEYDAAEWRASWAVAIGRESGDADATAYGLCLRASVLLVGRRSEEALALVDEALAAVGGGEPGSDVQMAPHLIRGYCLVGTDRLAEARTAFRAGSRTNDSGTFLTWYHCALAQLEFLRGDWEAALTEAQTGLEVPDFHGVGPDLRAAAALVQIHRGRRDEHTDFIRDHEPDLRGRTVIGYCHRWAHAMLCEAEGDDERAFQLLESFHRRPDQQGRFSVADFVVPDTARLAHSLGQGDRLRALAASARDVADAQPTASRRAVALLCSGLAGGDPTSAAEAAELFREADRPLYAGIAHESAALLSARAGLRKQAREELARAVEVYGALGADWPARRAEERLRAEGVRPAGGRSASTPGTGWESLTATERTVIAMIAEGCSNPQIADRMHLSRRTVQTYVSRILAKLGKSSRVELAVVASERAREL
ncbi:LuxR family transcriptional regulator [Kitasatospora cystarginea]|uniref:LuxR family transcriptional regulator n=1 Tax=Kitasatospora cystarginea TaxID=58350 RepID=A0ABN3ECJ0_9ACTN